MFLIKEDLDYMMSWFIFWFNSDKILNIMVIKFNNWLNSENLLIFNLNWDFDVIIVYYYFFNKFKLVLSINFRI